MDRTFFQDKVVLVMGLGQFGGGVDSSIFAARSGARRVIVTDLGNARELHGSLKQLGPYDDRIEYHLEGHSEEDFGADGGGADIIIANPAVGPENPYLQIARSAGKHITSQIELFLQLCPAQIVGITGANGKSTTTALTHHLLRGGIGQEGFPYRDVWLGGNIGHKPLLAVLNEIQADHLVVLEISSFQLEQLARIEMGPKVGVITNITPNHLDRHKTFEAYCRAKELLFQHQNLDDSDPAVSIFNWEDPVTRELHDKYENQNGRKTVCFKVGDVPQKLIERFRLVGKANLSNLSAALAVANHYGIGADRIAEAVESFRALPDRLEWVATIDGVRYFNDSISTTPTSTIAAIEAFVEPKILIAGGYDKNLPFHDMGEAIARDVKAAILIGQTADKIAECIRAAGADEVHVEIVFSLDEAVRRAKDLSLRGDVVLLSPACASYDMFENYRQRGEIFKQLVQKLRH